MSWREREERGGEGGEERGGERRGAGGELPYEMFLYGLQVHYNFHTSPFEMW